MGVWLTSLQWAGILGICLRNGARSRAWAGSSENVSHKRARIINSEDEGDIGAIVCNGGQEPIEKRAEMRGLWIRIQIIA